MGGEIVVIAVVMAVMAVMVVSVMAVAIAMPVVCACNVNTDKKIFRYFLPLFKTLWARSMQILDKLLSHFFSFSLLRIVKDM